jgi:hypothetical protein
MEKTTLEEIKDNPITEEEIDNWSSGTAQSHLKTYMLRIINGEYDLNEAREDILSFRKKD